MCLDFLVWRSYDGASRKAQLHGKGKTLFVLLQLPFHRKVTSYLEFRTSVF